MDFSGPLFLVLLLLVMFGAAVGAVSTLVLTLLFGEMVKVWSLVAARLMVAFAAPASLTALWGQAYRNGIISKSDMPGYGIIAFGVMAPVAAMVGWPLACALIRRNVKPTRRP